ncbi:histone-like nucleoid-structuring protein Lsr2 [Saccharopolyspora mangrovi]|uniref:Lsr2 family protein n=1 Tax=Saccharopolyspora mangrovi TaxID=3082379 RepID=A0ABU6AF21_9PSEU|nr:Lsr2 family protein [Saccharopolyspora sp. S2-29]MEB3370063.1 Lsr2 family protein [Saccharopolyspora sp. S2-29]
MSPVATGSPRPRTGVASTPRRAAGRPPWSRSASSRSPPLTPAVQPGGAQHDAPHRPHQTATRPWRSTTPGVLRGDTVHRSRGLPYRGPIVEFALDGVNYQIDLPADNAAQQLRDSWASFVANARNTGGRKRRVLRPGEPSGAPTQAVREHNQAIREWVRQRGLQVSDRGRVPSEIVERYEQPTAQSVSAAATITAADTETSTTPRL